MKLKAYFGGILFFLVGLILSSFTLRTPAPEAVVKTWAALPAFLIFVLFVAAFTSLGAWVRTRLKVPFFSGSENGLFDLTTGSVLVYILSYVLTALHLFSSDLRILLWGILAVCFSSGYRLVKIQQWFDFAKTGWAKFFLAVPLLIVFLRLIEGLQFPMHADAYITYLPAPRIWADHGNFSDFVRFTQFFLSTSWESLYAWGTALMGLKGGAGLDLTQYFGQWCTAGIGLTGITLASIALCTRLATVFAIDSIWFPVAAVTALQVPILRWTANLAKHDMGVSNWGFAAFYFTLFLAPISPALAFVAGLVTGTAVIGKLTVSLLGICLGLYVLINARKHTIWFSIGGVLGGMPVFLRNFALTGNPVFPWMSNHFPSPGLLSKNQTAANLHPTTSALDVSNFKVYLLELNEQLPLWILLIIAFALVKNKKQFAKWTWVPILATFLFTAVFRSSTEIRYQNANLVIMACLICFSGFYILTKLPIKLRNAASAVFAVAIIAFANIPTFTLFQIGSSKFEPISKALPKLNGGDGAIWIRKNLKTTDSVIAIGDPYVLYTIDYSVAEIVQTPAWDDRLSERSPKDFKDDLIASSYEYAFFMTDVPYWDRLAKEKQIMAEFNQLTQSCKLYSSPDSEIWDLKCLRANPGTGSSHASNRQDGTKVMTSASESLSSI